MRVRFEGPKTVATLSVGIIVEERIHASGGPSGVRGTGSKRPLAVVVRTGTQISAIDRDGRRLDRAALDALCPGAIPAMEDGMHGSDGG